MVIPPPPFKPQKVRFDSFTSSARGRHLQLYTSLKRFPPSALAVVIPRCSISRPRRCLTALRIGEQPWGHLSDILQLDRSAVALGSIPMPKPGGNTAGAGPAKGGRKDEEFGRSPTGG